MEKPGDQERDEESGGADRETEATLRADRF
jgi:hypothetical protein